LLENAEQHYSSAVRDAEQGLAGAVRRFLVVLASVGLTEVLTAKAEKFAAEQRPDPSPLTNVVAAALFHACRALLMLRRWPDPPADRLRALELQEADSRVRGCLKRLALALSTDPKLQLEPSINGHPAPLSEVVTSWSRALSPDAWQHAERVSRHASRMATRLCSDEGSQVLDEDIGLVSHAHDLFGRVEPSRVLALFRELETSTLPDPVDRREWISCAEWTTPILLHGRLAALFLDLVLNARSRLGVDRFEQIEQALGSHTTGQKDPPALARLLFVSDTLELLGKAKREGRHLGHSLEDVERAATNDSSLRDAYRLCVQARVEVLDSTGKTPATDTLLAWSNFKCEYSVP
jgi:HD superfamily phosphohydrolase YqeK